MFTAWKAVVIRNMAMKAVALVLFVCFVDLASATYCTYGSLSSDECYGYLESCCSDGVCRERCYVCSYDSQCGTGECCNSNSECATYCSTYIDGGAVAGVVIGCLVIVAIIASIVACCCCACCPYYRHRHPGTVLVAQPGYQPTVSTTTQLQTIQHPPPSGYNPPNAGFYPPPPPGGYSQPPPPYYPQPQLGPYPPPQAPGPAPYPPSQAPGPAPYPPPQAHGPYPQYPASTGQPIKQ